MNILFICDEYPPGPNGGIGAAIQVLSRELVKQGHNVFVVGLYSFSYGQNDIENDCGVRVWRFRYGLKLNYSQSHLVSRLINNIPDQIKQFLNGRQAYERFISFVHTLVKTENIDVIEIPDWNTFAMRIGFTVNWPVFTAPLILRSHGSYTKICHDLNKKPKKKLKRNDELLFSRADAISAVSKYTADADRKLFGPKKEITVIYNGIEIPAVAQLQPEASSRVIFTGTLIAAKGICQLARAWNRVVTECPDSVLHIYGKGDIAMVKSMLSAGSMAKVQFKGHVSRTELFAALASATVAVFPSYSESFALAPMEAMAVGCPVIYTSRASGSELITDGVDGKLIDPDDVSGIAQEIIKVLRDKSLQQKYSKNGRNTIMEKFSIYKIAKDHVSYYTQIKKEFKK